jgi:hypothetical protein
VMRNGKGILQPRGRSLADITAKANLARVYRESLNRVVKDTLTLPQPCTSGTLGGSNTPVAATPVPRASQSPPVRPA